MANRNTIDVWIEKLTNSIENTTFREFKLVIDNSGDFRQQWFDFKNKWQQDFVLRQLNRLKP